MSLSGADPEKAATLLKQIAGENDIEQLESREKETVSFEIKTSDDFDLRKEIYLKIKETDWIITELFMESKSLEKIFRELTKEN